LRALWRVPADTKVGQLEVKQVGEQDVGSLRFINVTSSSSAASLYGEPTAKQLLGSKHAFAALVQASSTTVLWEVTNEMNQAVESSTAGSLNVRLGGHAARDSLALSSYLDRELWGKVAVGGSRSALETSSFQRSWAAFHRLS
jgi:hypothetical protein